MARGRKSKSDQRPNHDTDNAGSECSTSGIGNKRKGARRTSPPAPKQRKSSQNICAVCLGVMTCREDMLATPCAHVFCTVCLLTALEYCLHCPLCRAPIDKKEYKYDRASQTSEIVDSNDGPEVPQDDDDEDG